MGTVSYGSFADVCTIDDRTLLHLHIVIVTKLRRGERFLFRCDTDEHTRAGDSFWISPDVPLRFTFTEPTRPPLNAVWLDLLSSAAYTTAGLWIVPEPALTPTTRAPVPTPQRERTLVRAR